MPPKPDWLAKKIQNNVKRKRAEDEAAEKQRTQPTQASYARRAPSRVPITMVVDDRLESCAPFAAALSASFMKVGAHEATEPAGEGEHSPPQPRQFYEPSSILPCEKMICWTVPSTVPHRELQSSNLLPIGVVLVSNAAFVEAVLASESGVEFAAVSDLIGEISNSIAAFKPNGPPWRIVLTFVELNTYLCKAQRRLDAGVAGTAESSRSNGDSTGYRNLQHLVEQACIYATVEHRVEVQQFAKFRDLLEHLNHMTRTIGTSQLVSQEKNLKQGEYVMKAHRKKAPEGLDSEQQRRFEQRQTWCAMLQMVPGVSQEKAASFASHENLSCPSRMYGTLKRLGEEVLPALQTSFGVTKTGHVRNEVKLARIMYGMMLATDPSQTL